MGLLDRVLVNGTVPMFINGEFVLAADGATFESREPATGKPYITIAEGGEEDIERAVSAARNAFEKTWRNTLAVDRARLLLRIGQLVDEHQEELAQLESRDNGKSIRETRAEVSSIARFYEYYAGVAQNLPGQTLAPTGPHFNYTLREPVGVVGAIIPWNSPLMMITWKVCPALAGGNTIVIKPAEDTPVTATAFATILAEAGVPNGVVNFVHGFGGRAGSALVDHPDVDKIAFTGSTDTGKMIAEKAARGLKLVTFELGGKSPSIIFPDANIDNAVRRIAYGIFSAGGQSCIAASRVLVHTDIKEEFLAKFADKANQIRVGNPLDDTNHVGSQTSQRQLEKIQSYVEIAENEGALVAAGGGRPSALADELGGYFFSPTILANVKNSMRVAQEEIFGPVTAVIDFTDEDDAVRIANDTVFGLAASVWTENIRVGHRVAGRINAGTVWINNHRSMNWVTPFGGYKQSGYGRENGIHVMDHYTQTKSVWVDLADDAVDWFE